MGGFQDRLLDAEAAAPGVLAVDLRALTFLDSMALGALVEADKRSRRDGRRLIVITTPGPVERLLEITGLDGRLELADEPPGLSEQ